MTAYISTCQQQNERNTNMKWFKINWDAGYGPNDDLIEAESLADAEEQAYATALEEAENNMDHGAEEYTREMCIDDLNDPEDYGFEPLTEDEQSE